MLVTGEELKQSIIKPVLTRWEHVGMDDQHVNTYLQQWKDVASSISLLNTKSKETGIIS